MTKYVVVTKFKDLQDKNHIYNVGDKYPRSGTRKEKRIKELLGEENKLGSPVIELVEEETPTENKEVEEDE